MTKTLALVVTVAVLSCGGDDGNKFESYVKEMCLNMERCGLLSISQGDCRALMGDELKHAEDPENCARCGRTLSCAEWQEDPIRCDLGAACQMQ